MYKISRGFDGFRLTPAQRTSSRFSEEPLVLGRVIRKGSKPIKLTDEQYELNKPKLAQLIKAGAIKIRKIEDRKVRKEVKVKEVEKEDSTIKVDSLETSKLDSSEAKVETTPESSTTPEISTKAPKKIKGK